MTTETLREERPDEDRRLAIRHLTRGGSDFAELNRKVNAAGQHRRRPATTPCGCSSCPCCRSAAGADEDQHETKAGNS